MAGSLQVVMGLLGALENHDHDSYVLVTVFRPGIANNACCAHKTDLCFRIINCQFQGLSIDHELFVELLLHALR